MSESSQNPQEFNNDQLQLMEMIIELRKKAFLQIIFGLAWWLGSSIAMYVAMAQTGDSIYWYGGALGSLFHWYRAFKMISATYKFGAKKIVRNEVILVSVTALIVFFSAGKIVPEYFKIETPTIGTCWAGLGGGNPCRLPAGPRKLQEEQLD